MENGLQEARNFLFPLWTQNIQPEVKRVVFNSTFVAFFVVDVLVFIGDGSFVVFSYFFD